MLSLTCKVMLSGNLRLDLLREKDTEGPALREFWDLKKTALRKICVSGTVGGSLTNTKMTHLHLHKPEIVVVRSAVVKTV